MAIDIQTVNLALFMIGAKKLASLSDDTKAAREANTVGDQCIKEVFDLPIDWRFAVARAELARLAVTPAFGKYDYYYGKPENCRRIIATVDEDEDDIEYDFDEEVYIDGAIQTDCIVCNEEEVFVKYIVLRDNPAVWPAYFKKLVAIRIAQYLSGPMNPEGKAFYNKLVFLWDQAYDEAKSGNAARGARVNSNNERIDDGNTDIVNAADRDME